MCWLVSRRPIRLQRNAFQEPADARRHALIRHLRTYSGVVLGAPVELARSLNTERMRGTLDVPPAKGPGVTSDCVLSRFSGWVGDVRGSDETESGEGDGIFAAARARN